MTAKSIQTLLDWLEVKGFLQNRNIAEADLLCDQNTSYLPIYIHLLMGFGALIGSLFIISLLLTMHYLSVENYSYLYIGSCFILFALIFYFPFRKSKPLLHSFSMQTALMFMLIGKMLFVLGVNQHFPIPIGPPHNTWALTLALFSITLLTYFIFPNVIDRFLSCLATLLSLLFNLVSQFNNSIPLFIIFILSLAVIYGLCTWHERPKAWEPLVIVCVIYVCFMSIFLSSTALAFISSSQFYWKIPTIAFNLAVAVFLIALCLHLSGSIKNVFELPVTFSCIGFIIISLISNNGILWSIALLMLGYGKHYRSLTIFGIIFLIVFLAEYYYSLNMTLQHKSYILMSSGIFLLMVYAAMKYLNWDKN